MFVSKYTAQWFVQHGYEVYVLNRGSRCQVDGVHLICADRHDAGLAHLLKGIHFDAVLDICAYNAEDVTDLLRALHHFDDYILISSSAVYPETNPQPFQETQPVGSNSVWGKYGTDKIEAEQALLALCPQAYILRPPYLYGPMQNVYREPCVFECALKHRPFCIPQDGSMPLQFFHVEDLCRVMEAILLHHPEDHVLNVGNPETVTIKEFVEACYAVAGKPLQLVSVSDAIPQRSYFSFHNYAYKLDVTLQATLLPETVPLEEGLADSFRWYIDHPDDVIRKDYIDFIDKNILKTDC